VGVKAHTPIQIAMLELDDALDIIKSYIDDKDVKLNEKINSLSSVTITLDADVSSNHVALDIPDNYLDIVIEAK
tara:strand:+ start:9339 stop:9560 length:222 start_codon:yes stop_codon:yes gene_type:complete